MTEFDPLTAPFLTVYRHTGGRPCDCDEAAYHCENCWTTPVYAGLIDKLGSVWELIREIDSYAMRYMRTTYTP